MGRKRKQVIQSSYIRIKYYNLLYKSISHPLTKKNKAKNLYEYYHTFSQNRKIRERKQTKKLTTYKLKKSKSYCTQTRSKKTTLIIPNVLTDMKNVKSIRRCLEK